MILPHGRSGAIVLVVALAACSARTPVIEESGSPSPSVSASARPRVRTPAAIQAVYTAEDALWLYNVKRNTTVQLAAALGAREPRWVSNNQVSFVQGNAGETQVLRLVDIKDRVVSDVFEVDTGIDTYGWSPDREMIAYITTDRFGYPHLEYRSVGAGVTQSVATLAKAAGRGIAPSDQRKIAFNRDGQYVAVVDTYADGAPGEKVPKERSQFQVRSLVGALVFAADQFREPTMAEWAPSGGALYYRTNSGLRAWKAGAADSVAMRGPKWFDPWVSPGGSFVAFDTGLSRQVVVATLMVKTGRVEALTKAGFYHPVVASIRTVWVQRVAPCRPDCPAPVAPAPEVFAVDIKTKKLRKLALPTLTNLDVRYG